MRYSFGCWAAVVAATLLAGSASATLIDGRFDPGEGYTHQFEIQPSKIVNGNPTGPATLWMYQDAVTMNVSVIMILPTSYVDNTYGTNAIGWGGKGHTFNQLVGSDQAVFAFGLGGPSYELTLDYLDGNSKTGGPWTSGLDGKQGEFTGGSALNILASRTSIDYNLNDLAGGLNYLVNSPATDANYTPNSSIPDWVFEVAYEFEIDGDLFGNQQILGNGGFMNGFYLELASLHASPNKGGEFEHIIPPPPTVVPEPASMLLFLGGAAGYLVRRRRQRG